MAQSTISLQNKNFLTIAHTKKFHQTEAEGDDLIIATNARPTKLLIDNFFQITLKFIGAQEVYLTTEGDGSITLLEDIQFNSLKIDGVTDLTTQIGKIGDNSASNPIDINDVIAQLKDILGLDKLLGNAKNAADINNDDEVEISDVIGNLCHIVGLEKLDTFDLVIDAGIAINSLETSSLGNL